ncbi:MAG: tRNA-specific adenosine deaminase, partial [bacterium]|nr:tRNA-specific adenosine deaminase [bacterium]
IVNARMVRLVFGCSDPKAGAVQTLFQIGQDKRLNHCLKMTVGVEANASSHLLTSFFKKLRD